MSSLNCTVMCLLLPWNLPKLLGTTKFPPISFLSECKLGQQRGLRPPGGACETHLHQTYKYCFIRAMPSQCMECMLVFSLASQTPYRDSQFSDGLQTLILESVDSAETLFVSFTDHHGGLKCWVQKQIVKWDFCSQQKMVQITQGIRKKLIVFILVKCHCTQLCVFVLWYDSDNEKVVKGTTGGLKSSFTPSLFRSRF